MWSRQQAQDRADDLSHALAQPERAIRDTAAGIVAKDGMTFDLIGDQAVTPWGGNPSELRFRLPWRCDDPFVLQLVIEEQFRAQIEEASDST